jgi:hypothetical protein
MQMNPPSRPLVLPTHERPVVRRRSVSHLSARSTTNIEKIEKIKNHDDVLCTSRATKAVHAEISMSLKNRTLKMKNA